MQRVDGDGRLAAGIAQLVAAVDDTLIDAIARDMAGAMASGVFAGNAGADLVADALAASQETARGFMMSVGEEPWGVEGSPHALINLARTLARRGYDLSVLMKLVRSGQSVFWPAIMKTVAGTIEEPTTRMQVLEVVFDRFGRYVETVLDGAVEVFQHERDLRVRGDHARRAEMIERLLAGEEPDPDRASRVLGYELRRLHTALAIHDRGDQQHRLDAIAHELAPALGARGVMSLRSGSRGLWAWVATDAPVGPAEREAVHAVDIPPGLRVAIGSSAPGLTGFRRSHDEAIIAQRIASLQPAASAVTWHADVEIVALLAADQAGAQALVARELGGLTSPDAQTAKLRSTALAYLQCAGSPTAAARELGVHTNTVRYRLEQVETALGRPLEGRRLELELALMLVETLGPGLLPAAH